MHGKCLNNNSIALKLNLILNLTSFILNFNKNNNLFISINLYFFIIFSVKIFFEKNYSKIKRFFEIIDFN